MQGSGHYEADGVHKTAVDSYNNPSQCPLEVIEESCLTLVQTFRVSDSAGLEPLPQGI